MKLGFTGTREGTTTDQHKALCEWVKRHFVDEFHHGACIGADAEADEVVGVWAPKAKHVAHPPTNRSLVSALALHDAHEERPPLPYLERNRAIVDACDTLVACPKGPEEQRSGTWSTVRYARRQGKRIVIVWPDGNITQEN